MEIGSTCLHQNQGLVSPFKAKICSLMPNESYEMLIYRGMGCRWEKLHLAKFQKTCYSSKLEMQFLSENIPS